MADTTAPSRRSVSIFAILTVGWAISTYLWLRPPAPGATVLGVSLAVWGMFYFAAVGFLLSFSKPAFTISALVVSAAGCGAVLTLHSRIVTILASACPLCLTLSLASAALVISIWAASRTRRLTAVGLIALMSGAALESAILRQPAGTARVDPTAAWQQYRSQPVQEIPASPDDPILGSTQAQVRLVVFSSFGCPACRTLAPVLHRLHDRFGDRLTIVFKHFPLSKDCNPSLKTNLQPRSCEAAWAAQAASLQGAFWPFHDGIFSSDLRGSEATLHQIALQAKFDGGRWEADRVSGGVRAKVMRDVELGNRLQVRGTPWVMINGRRVQRPGFTELETIIERLLPESAARLIE